jgi:hypothetical protein
MEWRIGLKRIALDKISGGSKSILTILAPLEYPTAIRKKALHH